MNKSAVRPKKPVKKPISEQQPSTSRSDEPQPEESDNFCKMTNCKRKVSLIYIDCQHCAYRFCTKHALPEIHGCGERIKQAEQEKLKRPTPQQLIHHDAKERLNKKLRDLQDARRPQKRNQDSSKTN